ncbi:MAG: hypothetical protein MGG11_00010 [Trichodesmium sp. MAG_R03]|nr:hypothetical protein [Trichodesmium sp. MAG_R03]
MHLKVKSQTLTFKAITMTSSVPKTLNYHLPPLENGDRLTRAEFEGSAHDG